MNHKDYFSSHSKVYAAFRPSYPEALYKFIFQHLEHKNNVWDCATGNGQVAHYLSTHFKNVFATDISQQQLDNAFQAENIFYSVCPAEQTPFQENQFDLITVGQALHWFDRDKFFAEVKRVAKPNAILAVWGYALLYIDATIDSIIMNFYSNIVGPYWDSARNLVEDEYRTITFPFEEITSPKFNIEVHWTLEHITGYLSSWSATQKYIKAKGIDPVPALRDELSFNWRSDEMKTVRLPIFLRMFRP